MHRVDRNLGATFLGKPAVDALRVAATPRDN
jgi:hypothetical protein